MPGFLAEVLTWETGRWAVPILKTARSWSVPPLTLMTGKKTDWSDERNRMLAVALTIVETETCDRCGTPAWIGRSTDSEIVFEVESSTCFGCAELEKDQEARKGQKRAKGEIRYPVARNVWEDAHLPSRYDSYMRERKES